MQFDLNSENASIIKVIGVGGGGTNAVNHMYEQGIKGVDFIVCNTDQQSLDSSPVPTKITLGESLTKGRGAGSVPEVGKNAAIESIDVVRDLLTTNTEMLFVTAGLGGGTGTGAAPIIANIAKELGILTVGIITIPFGFEGKKRMFYANEGLDELKENLDTLLIINNDKLRDIYGNLKMREAFAHADNIVATAARGIAEIITTTLQINTDINDVKTVMKDSGVAIMGSAQAEGEDRATIAVENALTSPLLNDNNIYGAKYVLVNVMCGEDDNELTMDEFGEIADYIQEAAGMSAEIIKGYGVKAELGQTVSVTIIATGFNLDNDNQASGKSIESTETEKVVHQLDTNKETNTAEAETPKSTTNTATTPPTEPSNAAPEEEMKMFIRTEPTETPTAKEPKTPAVVNTNESLFEEKISESPNPSMFEFELKTRETPKETPQVDDREAAQLARSQERISKLKDLSFKMKSQNGLTELENEPAYVRKQVSIDSTPHSSESQISRFSLTSEGEGSSEKTELRQNNSFLHDNVD